MNGETLYPLAFSLQCILVVCICPLHKEREKEGREKRRERTEVQRRRCIYSRSHS